MPSGRSAACSIDALHDDELLLVLAGCRLSTMERSVLALVSKRWRRLSCSPDLIRQGVAATIQSSHVERLQSLRRWLRIYAGALQSLTISLSAAGGAAENKAASAALGRCLVAACLGGAVQELRVEWLSTTQLRLGAELAFCGSCPSVRRLTLWAARGAILVACPLGGLVALESASVRAAVRWDHPASLPAFLTSLDLHKVSDAHRTRLPSQLSALSRLQRLALSDSDLPADGYGVLTSLPNLRHLSLCSVLALPAALRQLTALRRFDLESCGGGWWAPGGALQDSLQAMPHLTALCLSGSLPTLPAPGAALPEGLQLLLDTDWHPVFQPAHWPASLRAVVATWPQLLEQPLGRDVAPKLHHLAIQPSYSFDWGRAARQPGWAALWAWLEHAPDLRLLEIRNYYERELPMVLSAALLALKRRRPGLRVATRGLWHKQRCLDAALSFCDPDPA